MTISGVGSPQRGEVWWVTFPGEHKPRPCVILSADWLNRFARDVMAVPITSVARGNFPTRVPLAPPEGGLKMPCWAKCDQVTTVRKEHLSNRVGSLGLDRMEELERAVRDSLDL